MLNISLITMKTNWINPPAAVPCKVLPTIKVVMFLLSAAMIELPKNSAAANNRSGFRPQISENFAQRGAEAALASR